MFPNLSNVNFSGGTFIDNHDNGTVINEQNGMTGASYEFIVY